MTTYKVFVNGEFFSTVATLEGAETIRDHWASPHQIVQIVEERAMFPEEIYYNDFLRLEATLDLDPNPWGDK